MEEPENNPFLHAKSKQMKKKESPKVRRQTSLTLVRNWKSVEKPTHNRESKILPVMDIGRLNSIRKTSLTAAKQKGKLDYQAYVPSQ